MIAPPDDSKADLRAVIAALRAERDRALSELAARTGELTQRDSGYSERIGHQAATETLKVENQELRAAQAAGLEVLQAMIASPGDTQPVFDLIARQAANLCEVPIAAVGLFDGTMVHLATQSGFDAAYADVFAKQFPRSPSPDFAMGRAILNRRVEQIEDTGADTRRGFSPPPGPGSALAVPLLRNGTPLGVIAVGRRARGSFSRNQITLLQTFAEQAVIAISSAETFRALQARTVDLQESLEQQTATAEVLQVINASPGNLAPVFDAMLEKALRLCDATFGVFWQRDGESFYPAALHGVPKAFADHLMRNPVHPSPNSGVGRTARGEPFVHITDTADSGAYRSGDPQRRALVDLGGGRTALWVGLRGDGRVPGVFTIYRKEVRPFTDKQIALLQNFAAQAVIAMENARLLTEQQEALEQQTATAEVLGVINALPGNLAPVFEAILEKAVRLCESSFGILATYDGECFHNVVARGAPPALADFLRKPMRSTPGTSVHRIVHGEDVVHVPDIVDDEAYRAGNPARRALADLGGGRTQLVVALRKDETLLGLVNVYRQEVRPFSDKQIALLQNFAAQAVIAMENARLLTEQQEALEQQTATAEVLGVINASPGNLAPVFAAILSKAHALCGAALGSLASYDGEVFSRLATHGYPPEYEALVRLPNKPLPHLQRLLDGARFVHDADLAAPLPWNTDDPYRRAAVEIVGIRTALFVPLRKDGRLLGYISAQRREVRPFSEKEIALLENFAAQAVIAMENARLINEQREALEQQTATAEVLQVINSSPGNLAPVFDAVLERALRLCGASFGTLATYDGEHLERVAFLGVPPAFIEYNQRNPLTKNAALVAQGIATGKPVQATDIMTDERLASSPSVRDALVELGGVRALLQVPLLKDGGVVGFIGVWRREPGAFPDRQVALVEGFAAQAVIAMENARLLTEQQEALEQQTATAEVLQVINASPGNLAPVFDAMLEKAMRLCEAQFGVLSNYDGERFRIVAAHGIPVAYTHGRPEGIVPDPGSALERVANGDRVVHIPDLVDTDAYRQGVTWRLRLVATTGARTALWVGLRKDDALLGVFVIYRREVRAFSDKQIALVRNFADQAVIAIENTRLLTEQREALEQQTATAEVLQVINASPGNLAPVFDAILERAHHLCGAAHGVFGTYDGDYFRAVASRGLPAAVLERLKHGFHGLENPITRPLFDGALFVQIPDLKEIDHPMPKAVSVLGGFRTALFVPLRKDGTLLGHITALRSEVRPFTDKQIALLQNFAAQAVIAMENARLLTEQQEALEQQTATAEVLQVINASPGNLAPVFDAMLEKAMRLCEAQFGVLSTYDGERFRRVAAHGMPVAETQGWPEGVVPDPGSALQRVVNGDRVVHILDLVDTDAYRQGVASRLSLVATTGARSALWVGLRKDDALLGVFVIYRREVRAFSDKQIALVRNFADQAVIAIENTRLLTEQQEALEQQTATAEVLQVINASPGNLTPVFDTILEKALRLCEAAFGSLVTYDGEYFWIVATRGLSAGLAKALLERGPLLPSKSIAYDQIVRGADIVHIPDIIALGAPFPSSPNIDQDGARTTLFVPLRGDDALFGAFVIFRKEVRLFSDKQIALLKNFAAQAVIAMENARLLDEIRQRQEELRVTFENMGDGVALFDETQHLVAWNRKFQDILDVPDDVIARRQTFSEYVHYLAERGEFGPGADTEEHVRRLVEQAGQSRTHERTRPDGRVIEIRHNPVASGGFVLIYADITERKRNEVEIRAARDAAEEASRTIEAAYRELKTAQANLIQAEKMASLGQLTAGIAHEIKNPLNFINNFSALSTELIDELREVLAPEPLADTVRAEVEDLTGLLKGNLQKVVQHGQRADGIVKSMLEHSRGSSGERRMVDLNAVIDEALNLAYHGARAQDQSFNITLERRFGEGIAPIEVNPQDMTRVFLNIFANGFYAATSRARDGGDARFMPTLKVTTRDVSEAVEIRVRDNGIGIPDDIREKLFQPFFTTKPTGEGTGLGLSITYDIVTQQHGGSIAVDSKPGEFSEFTIRLPRNP